MSQPKHSHLKLRQRNRASVHWMLIRYVALVGILLGCWGFCSQECRAGIYFGGGGTITRAEFDGSNATDLVSESTYGIALDMAQGHIYWVRPAGKYDWEGIKRSNLDGTGVTTLVDLSSSNDFPTSIALDLANGHMYWTASRIGYIRRADLDGSNVTSLVTSPYWAPHKLDGLSLDLVHGKMYWTDATTDALRWADLDGSNAANLMTGVVSDNWGSTALDLANGHLYWSTDRGGKIQRSGLDGSGVTDIVTGIGVTKMALDLDNRHVYWAQDGRGSGIRRANLDGSGIVDILSLSSYYNPHAIALDTSAVPEPSSFAVFGGLLGIGLLWRLRRRTSAN